MRRVVNVKDPVLEDAGLLGQYDSEHVSQGFESCQYSAHLHPNSLEYETRSGGSTVIDFTSSLKPLATMPVNVSWQRPRRLEDKEGRIKYKQ